MELRTPMCRMLGMDVPVVQAPVGSASTPELAAAVAHAGGLGMLSLTWTPSGQIQDRLDRLLLLASGRSVGVNVVLAFPIAEQLEAALTAGVRVVSTFWGDPAEVQPMIRAAGVMHLHTVGSAAEAVAAVDAGVDVVVAQGVEAGGHVWGSIPTMVLVPAVVDAVGGRVPVVAAGGIADGRGLAAVLALGAQAAWMGTRFLAAQEAATHEVYRERVVAAAETDAVHTLAFGDGWPGAPHRALLNSTLRGWLTAGGPGAPDRPGEGEVVARDGAGAEYVRYGDMMPLPGMSGDLEAMALYAGCSAGLVHEVLPAAEIVRRTTAEARVLLSG